MTSGYNILWTEHALTELEATITYLEKNWTEKELKKTSYGNRENHRHALPKSFSLSIFRCESRNQKGRCRTEKNTLLSRERKFRGSAFILFK